MSNTRSSCDRKPAPKKPKKPYPTFPLFPHATKRWAKKIRQKTHYFGPWDDPTGSLNRYMEVKDRLHAGLPIVDEHEPDKPAEEGLMINELCAQFLRYKKGRVLTGELSERSYANYRRTCKTIEAFFGPERIVQTLKPTDFDDLRSSLAEGRGLVTLSNEIRHVRILFNYCDDKDLIGEKRIRFGSGFTVCVGSSVKKGISLFCKMQQMKAENDQLRRELAAKEGKIAELEFMLNAEAAVL